MTSCSPIASRCGCAATSRRRTSPLNIQVVEPPSVPSVPAAPNRPIFLTLVLIVALGAGVAAAFVAGQLQTTFPTPQRLAQVTGLKVLGTVSEVVMPPSAPAAASGWSGSPAPAAALGASYARADAGRILAAQHGGMRSDMSKHSPQLAARARRRALRFRRGAARARAAPRRAAPERRAREPRTSSAPRRSSSRAPAARRPRRRGPAARAPRRRRPRSTATALRRGRLHRPRSRR